MRYCIEYVAQDSHPRHSTPQPRLRAILSTHATTSHTNFCSTIHSEIWVSVISRLLRSCANMGFIHTTTTSQETLWDNSILPICGHHSKIIPTCDLSARAYVHIDLCVERIAPLHLLVVVVGNRSLIEFRQYVALSQHLTHMTLA